MAAAAAPLAATVGDVPDLGQLLGAAPRDLRDAIERYDTDRGALGRRHPNMLSPRALERLRVFDRGWRAAIERIPFDKLTPAGKIDWVLFRNHLDYSIHLSTARDRRIEEVRPLIPMMDELARLDEARRNMEWAEPQQVATLLDRAAREIAAMRRTPPKVDKLVAARALRAIPRVRETLRDWFGFYDGYDPVFTWWVREPHKKLDAALQSHQEFVREKLVGIARDDRDTIVGDPVGRAAILRDLEYEMVPYTPEELVEIAKREFAWCDAEMLKASRELGFGEDWKKALEHVKTLGVAPGKQPELIRSLAQEAVEFVDKHDLVTVPPLARESWRMRMMSPERQRVNPFFTGGETISVSYPAEGMGHEQKLMSLRGNNIHFSRATVFHELIPGHHLQQFMNARHRRYRSLFATGFWIEGWALYWEMLLWDMGFHKSPADRVGALFWRMHRCARIVFSLEFHLGRMSAAEAVDYLVDRVGHERENAAGEVRRSVEDNGYSPLYQCAYMLGALQFRALAREVAGGGMPRRRFHDAVLAEHGMPVEMVRAAVSGRPPARDFRTAWRFAG
jgi:hypothetical protein